jgi:hypothetical protein
MENAKDQLFIIPLERELDEVESGKISTLLNEFLEKWNAHGNPLSANVTLEESRFLIIRNPDGQASGCSKDKLFREIDLVCSRIGVQQDVAGKFYVRCNGVIAGLGRKEFFQKQETADIRPDDLIFPTWISDSFEFSKSWKKPLHFFSNLQLKKDLV